MLVPSLVLLLALWVLEVRRMLAGRTPLKVFLGLVRAVFWTVLMYVVTLVVGVVTTKAFYCENCGTTPASAWQLRTSLAYVAAVAALLVWIVRRIRALARQDAPPGGGA